jgi:hypothetical protein
MTERDHAIVAMTHAGYSAPAIAAKFGITTRTVQRVRRRAGISHGPATPFTADEIRIAESLLNDGASYGEVARTLGRHPASVGHRFPNRSAWKCSSGGQVGQMFAAVDRVESTAGRRYQEQQRTA